MAREGAQFLKAKQQTVSELPVGMMFHYDLKLVYRTWQRWVQGGRKQVPDIRSVATEDDAAVNDVWMMDYVIRYIINSQSQGGEGGGQDV